MLKTGDVRRLFVQSVLSRGVMSEMLAKTIWKQCIQAIKDVDESVEFPDEDSEEANWNTFIASVNKTLDDLDFEFKLAHDEATGKKIYALVNRKDDEVAQLATDYTPAEIKYFRSIVEQIISASEEAFSISSLAALRDTGDVKPKTQAEITLGSFVAKGWVVKSKRGRYSLSTRTILELGAYLKSNYPDHILECMICKDIVTKGIACPTADCQVRMHLHCYTLSRRKRPSCPSCSQAWPADAKDMNPVGEAAASGEESSNRRRVQVKDEDEESHSRRSQAPRKSKGKSKSRGKHADMDTDDEEDQLEEDD